MQRAYIEHPVKTELTEDNAVGNVCLKTASMAAVLTLSFPTKFTKIGSGTFLPT